MRSDAQNECLQLILAFYLLPMRAFPLFPWVTSVGRGMSTGGGVEFLQGADVGSFVLVVQNSRARAFLVIGESNGHIFSWGEKIVSFGEAW